MQYDSSDSTQPLSTQVNIPEEIDKKYNPSITSGKK
jgi:hypothetical protein